MMKALVAAIGILCLLVFIACTNPVGSPSTSTPIPTGAIIATPSPSSTLYTVTFDANGGAGTMAAQSIGQGTAAKLTANSYSLHGYHLTGWNTLPNGSGIAYTDGSSYVMGTSNLTLFAQWTMDDLTSPTIGLLKGIPGGSFQRDSTPTNISVVSSLHMSQNLITRAQFLAVMGTDLSNGLYSSNGTNSPNDPVQNVNWYHAITFCNKLSILEGLTPVYTVSGVNFSTLPLPLVPLYVRNTTWDAVTINSAANGYRLPTEMEYMWAAMGGSSDSLASDLVGGVNTGGYLKGYAGSNEASGGQTFINNYEWTAKISPIPSNSKPVGIKLANELGLYDMTGNIFEWCGDWFVSPYPSGTLTNYMGSNIGTGSTARSLRGCGWCYVSEMSNINCRTVSVPYTSNYMYGFRVVRP